MFSAVRTLLFGSPLPTAAETEQRLSKVQALAVFSSDALSSVAYATEEILLVLVVAGSAAMVFSLPISVAIVTLLFIVVTSYYQTVHAYPSGGGAYIVAHDNLGVWPGLVAAAALLIDYVLTVAVSVTAGVAAITSAFPVLYAHRVVVAVLVVLFIAWANLRGVRESGTLFAVPTYGFILLMLTLMGVGVFRWLTGTVSPVTYEALQMGTQNVSVFLILRAFASGCTAMTGVEAISNGIPAFRKPEADNASKTLLVMAGLLATMFLGISFLSRALHIIPIEHETVVSQIGRQVFGDGPLYLALQTATALILVLAANTSFADFPRLSAILARDRYLPHQLTNRGDRLVFANGIIALAVLASLLIILFGGRTHRLIPLYAVGVFLSFTLSQAGMVLHWYRLRGPRWVEKLIINGVGMLATGIVLIVVAITKFVHGAWIVILLIPAFVWAFRVIKRHYGEVARQLSLEGLRPQPWTDVATHDRHKVVVPVSGMHRGTLEALHFARVMSKDVTAVIVDLDPAETARVQEKWVTWGQDIPLVVLPSPYRSMVGPLLQYLDETDERDPERGTTVVVLPEFVPARWWHYLLHNQTALVLKTVLIYRRGKNGKSRVIIDVPYRLQS